MLASRRQTPQAARYFVERFASRVLAIEEGIVREYPLRG